MTEKEKYIEFCGIEKDIPIFSQYWWLDAVCGKDNWNVGLVEKNKEIIASLPYEIKNKFLFRTSLMPYLTQKLGIYIKYPENLSTYKRLSFEKTIFDELINKIPKFDWFLQNFDYTITNWLPLYWIGFKQTTKYTYVIDNLSDLDKVWNNFHKSAKKNINKAKESVTLKESDNINILHNSIVNNPVYKDEKYLHDKNYLNQIYLALNQNNSVRITHAIDKEKNIHSTIMGIFDNNSLYIILSSSDKELRQSGAEYLLYWDMIQFASKKSLKFDFEGSMLSNIEIRNRSFGSTQKPYFQISKMKSRLIKIRYFLKEIF